jgi:hypothetical protein
MRRAWFFFHDNLGFRSHFRRWFWNSRLGKPSQYIEGQWVQVQTEEEIRKTLDDKSRHRGLVFLPYQWAFCGGVYRVQKVMRRIIDDRGIFRAVSRTVLLEGVDCGGISGSEGCGRRCPLMFRDDWLKPLPSPAPEDQPSRIDGAPFYVRVRSAAEIRASLDKNGKRDGLMVLPEMFQWAGMRFRVAQRPEWVFEYNTHALPRRPIYILEGLQCSGQVLGPKAPCDRRCSILWHEDWLVRESNPN